MKAWFRTALWIVNNSMTSFFSFRKESDTRCWLKKENIICKCVFGVLNRKTPIWQLEGQVLKHWEPDEVTLILPIGSVD